MWHQRNPLYQVSLISLCNPSGCISSIFRHSSPALLLIPPFLPPFLHYLLLSFLPHPPLFLSYSAMNMDRFERGPREILNPEIQKVSTVMEQQLIVDEILHWRIWCQIAPAPPVLCICRKRRKKQLIPTLSCLHGRLVTETDTCYVLFPQDLLVLEEQEVRQSGFI